MGIDRTNGNDTDLASDIALNLARMRIAHDLSQEGLANRLGLSRQAVSKWERGESVPDLSNLIALADLYGTSVDALIHQPQPEDLPADMPERTPLEADPENGSDSTELFADVAGADTHEPQGSDASIASASVEHTAGSAKLRIPAIIERLRNWRPTKTVLIGSACCLCFATIICGAAFFAMQDRGRPTPAAGRTTAAEGVDSKTDYNGRLMVVAQESFDPQEVESFSIEWYNGSVTIRMTDLDVDDGMIHMTESCTVRLADDEVMQCRLRNGTIEATTVNAGLLVNAPQHLEVVIPTSAAKTFKNMHFGGLACDYTAQGITCDQLTADLPSDNSSLRTSDVTAGNLGVTKSGRSDAVLEGSFRNIQIWQTSGAIRVTSSVQPESLRANVSAGNLSIALPQDSAFAMNADVASGALSCGFEQFGTANVYSVDAEEDVEALCYGLPGITSPLYHLTARSSRIAVDPLGTT